MRTWLPLAVVVMLITLGLWYSESPPSGFLGKRPTPQQQSEAANLIIRDAKTRNYNTEGVLAYRVNAERITYYKFAPRDRADLIEPRILFYKQQKPKWLTQSKSGIAFNDGERVLLSGDVDILEQPQPGITLHTQSITVIPQEEFAETDDYVTVINGLSRTTGKGLRADLKQDKIKLLSEVKSIYEKP